LCGPNTAAIAQDDKLAGLFVKNLKTFITSETPGFNPGQQIFDEYISGYPIAGFATAGRAGNTFFNRICCGGVRWWV
jgi:hypothetical protein